MRSLGVAHEESFDREPSRSEVVMRTVRMSVAVTLLAALFVQSIVALTAPREARAGGRPTETLRQYFPSPQRSQPVGPPARYVPGHVQPGKDPRQC
jgi:hypothetical protein